MCSYLDAVNEITVAKQENTLYDEGNLISMKKKP